MGKGLLQAEQGLENRREAFESAFRHASAEEAGASKAEVLSRQKHGSPAKSAASKAGPKSEAAEPSIAEEEEEQESSEDIAATDRLTRGLVKKKKSEAKPIRQRQRLARQRLPKLAMVSDFQGEFEKAVGGAE